MVFLVLGAASGLCWGVADFFGGVQSRRMPALAVAFWSQLAGGAALLLALLALGKPPTLSSIMWGMVSGIFGGLGLALFYRALSIGVMSLVAPVAACGAVVPVVFGLVQGERPSILSAVGILVALGGVVLVSLQQGGAVAHRAQLRTALLLALGAALGFGLFYVFLSRGALVPNAQPLWTVAGARLSSLLTLVAFGVVSRQRLVWPGRLVGLVAMVGILDTGANVLFTYAASHGNLSIIAVLGSLYPVATVLLGRLVLHERLSRVQGAGVVCALLGVVLLSAR